MRLARRPIMAMTMNSSINVKALLERCRAAGVFIYQVTTELTDRRALTYQRSKTPRHQSEAQSAVRCSDLVRQSKVHRLKHLRSVSPHSRRRLVMPLRWKCNRERREPH